MNTAAAGERNEVGLLFRPLRERACPLSCPADLEGFLACQDHSAVHDADDEGRQLAGRDSHHRLVEQREAVADASVPHQHMALGVQAQCEQMTVVEAFADRGGFLGHGGGGLEVTRCCVAEDVRNQ